MNMLKERTGICIPIRGPSFAEAREQLTAALEKADLVELRLDLFSSFDLHELEKLRRECSLPVVFTLRPKGHGGSYIGPERERLAKIDFLAKLKPNYFDLEYDAPKGFIENFKKNN